MAKKKTKSTSTSFLSINAMRVIMAITVLLLYGKTVKYEYVLDDDLYITNHPIVQKGIAGVAAIFSQRSLDYISTAGGQQPYRPMTLFSFSIEKTLFDSAPQMAHLVNVLLLLILGLGIFQLLIHWFPKVHKEILFAVVMLFIAHPIHTEVVANVKSRDELLAMVFGIYACSIFGNT